MPLPEPGAPEEQQSGEGGEPQRLVRCVRACRRQCHGQQPGNTGRIDGAFSAFPKGQSQTGKGQPPGEYPDAQWSDAAGGWVVQRNGKWFRVKG